MRIAWQPLSFDSAITMRHARYPQVGLDSQCLSYLLDAIADISEPRDRLSLEKIALLRSWFYRPGTFAFTLTQTVISEVEKIPDVARRNNHESFIRTLFNEPRVEDFAYVRDRTAHFKLTHPKLRDCQILAEAEELGLDIVLTYDHDFWKRLHGASPTTRLIKPSVYWAELNVPRGAEPRTVPHHTNPLSQQAWWRW